MIYVKGRCASFHWLLLRQYPLYNVACTSGRKYSRSKRPTLEARRVKSVFGVSILAPHQLRFFRSTVNFPAWTGAVLVTQGLFSHFRYSRPVIIISIGLTVHQFFATKMLQTHTLMSEMFCL